MTLLIISVVLSVALTTLSLSIKQTRLATDTRDAEIAFHAANAGLECLRYWRRIEPLNFEAGVSQDIDCFGSTGVSPEENNELSSEASGDGSVYQYQYYITWGTGTDERCSEMRFLVFNADSSGSGLTLNDMDDYIPGYAANSPSDSKSCEAGGLCTVFSSRGYSDSCDAREQTGTIQRDILLEF